MNRAFGAVFLVCALVALAAPTYGQGSTSSMISGVVVDNTGAVIPGANVVVKHNATNTSQEGVSNSEGAFSFAGMQVGVYTVTVSLTGFKTVVVNNVTLTSGAPANVKATLEVGGISEQVNVVSSSEIVQTQSPTVSMTINTNAISKLPITSRSAMDFVNLLPGVSTPSGNRDATINGLPRGSINITLDGVNIQDNTLRSTDGFFAIVSPRLDAIEEVTVTTASQGAGDSGQGAVQVKFVTRAGTNDFTGSGYYYGRRDGWNANTWFNNRAGTAKAKLVQNQQGFRAGGPIDIPGVYDGHNKAFFFVNWEEVRQPNDVTRDRTILNASSLAGNFTYGTTTVNVLQLAAANGHVSTPDPTIAKILGEIRTATAGGSLQTIDSNLDRFRFNVPTTSARHYPTFRLDYNLNQSHRASFAYNYQKFTDYPDTLNNHDQSFPGFPAQAGQSSVRLGWSSSVRSTLSSNMVNEARFGYSGAPVRFFDEYNTEMFSGSAVNQGGFRLTFPSVNSTLTSPSPAPSPQSRNANSLLIEDTVTWLKGAHSITMGGSYTQYDIWAENGTLVPRLTFTALPADPASGMFTAANFPGASQANLTAAQQLFNLLTGRITAIQGDARLDAATGEYKYLGVGRQEGRLRESGVFLQDQWRLRPNFSLNLGVRYDIQSPFYALNSLYSFATIEGMCGRSGAASDNRCNMYQSGNMPGKVPTFQNLEKGTKLYDTDLNNFAPNLGFAWTPGQREGALGALMGREGDFVIRGGYSRSFSRSGLNDFTGVLNSNPGILITVDRDSNLGNLGTLPVLLRETSRLGAPTFPSKPAYPLSDVVTQDIRGFDPHLRIPSADSYSIGFQRGISRNMVIEVRYVGTRSADGLGTVNFNETNIFENGFLNEFKVAQANLAANIAAGRGNTFAFTGAAGTAPLPTFLGFFNGVSAANASNAAAYTGTNWTSATFLNFLAMRNPNPFGFANTNSTGLMGSAAFRANAAAAGIPANYFLTNPDLLGGGVMTTNLSSTRYNSMQLELRRRYSDGLQFSGSYVFGHGYQSQFETLRGEQFELRDTGTPGDITHQIKLNLNYDLPFGQGKRWASNANAVVERVIGGWQLGFASRMQSGRLIDLGNRRLVGMTKDDLQGMFKLRFDDAGRKVWMLPQDVIDNTILAFNVSPTTASGYAGATPTGRFFAPANGPDCIEIDNGADYGACASRSLVVTGPFFRQHDLRLSKRTKITSGTDFELAIETLNVFNQANFTPVGGIGNVLADYEVTGLSGTNTSRALQIVTRFNW